MHALRRIGLHHHALQAALAREVVDVGRAERGGDGGVDGVEADAQGAGLVAVDVELQLRCVFQAVGAHAGEQLALRGQAQQLVARRDQRVTAIAATVLQAEVESGGAAQFGDRRRAQGEDERILHAHHRAEGAPRQVLRRLPGCVPLVPVLQRDEGQRRVLALAGEAEAEHADHAFDFGLLEHEALDLLHHLQAAVDRGARRQLHVDDDVALVLVGQERGGQAQDQPDDGADDGCVDDQHPSGALQQARQHTFVAFGGGREPAVEPAEETRLGVVVASFHRLEQGRAQGRA